MAVLTNLEKSRQELIAALDALGGQPVSRNYYTTAVWQYWTTATVTYNPDSTITLTPVEEPDPFYYEPCKRQIEPLRN
jgi:hypothetical protein